MSDAEDPIRTSDLATRFAAAVVMIAVATVAIYVGGWLMRALVLAGAAIMLVEWGDMHRVRRFWSWVGAALLAVPLFGLSEYYYPYADRDPAELEASMLGAFWPALGAIALLALLLGLFSRRATMAWGFIYVAVPAFALLVLSWMWFELVFWLMVVTWSTDIFAYFAGRSIGGPKLAPRISPNKTWAGLAGGFAGAALAGALLAWLFALDPLFYFAGGPLGIIAQAGDLYESWVKRRAGVKDSGSLLPGHGGVLDRLDGLLPVILATLGLLALTLAPA